MADAFLFGEAPDDHFMYQQPLFGNDGIDPSDMQGNSFVPYAFGSGNGPQNMSSFNFGNSSIGTDELLDLEINPLHHGLPMSHHPVGHVYSPETLVHDNNSNNSNNNKPVNSLPIFDQNLVSKSRASMGGMFDQAAASSANNDNGKSLMGLATPESGSFPTPAIPRHQKRLSSQSNQWDGTPGSAQSYSAESPISSPGMSSLDQVV